jgi:trehalose/maltose transport system substrate-binding protein
VNNDAAIGAFERAAGWVGTISPPGVLGYVEEDARAVWHAGNAAFMRNWPYAYSVSLDSEAIGDVFDVAALPAGASGSSAADHGRLEHRREPLQRQRRSRRRLRQALRLLRGAEAPRDQQLDQPDDRRALPGRRRDRGRALLRRPRRRVHGRHAAPVDRHRALYNRVSTLYSTAVHRHPHGRRGRRDRADLLELDLEALLGN